VVLPVWLAVVEPLWLILCVKEVVEHSVDMPLTLGDSEEEGDADAVCVIVSLAEPKEAEAEPLCEKTLAVGETVPVCV
jgi:hypothetical protein